jgi:hypothetical protein
MNERLDISLSVIFLVLFCSSFSLAQENSIEEDYPADIGKYEL